MKERGVEVFSVCTTSDRQEWEKYIVENRLTWINGWDPQRATNYGYYYNVQSTPMIYILDRDKKSLQRNYQSMIFLHLLIITGNTSGSR